jgi:hypothetical protein
MLKNQEVYLYSNQTTASETYINAAAQSLAGSYFIEPLVGSQVAPELGGQKVEVVAGVFDQDAWVPGAEAAKGSIKMAMTPAFGGTPTSAGATVPYWAVMMQGLCDFSLATTDTNKHTLTPISYPTSAGRIEKYYGSSAALSSIREIFYNLKSTAKITFKGNEYPQIEFTPQGVNGTQTEGVTIPGYTKARVSPFAFKGATVTINGASLPPISGEIDFGQPNTTRLDPTQTSGLGTTETTDRKIAFKAKVYAALGTNIYLNLRDGTEAALLFSWGPTYRVIQIDCGSYAQITKVTPGDENGIKTWDIEGQVNRNALTIKINP